MVSFSDEKLSGREFASLILLTTGAKLADSTSMILIPEGSTATWMIPLISAATLLVPIILVLYLIRKYDTDLIEVCFRLAGRMGGTLIGVSLVGISLLAVAIDARNYVDTMSTLFFPQTPTVVLYSFFLGCSVFVGSRGLVNIGRSAWIVLPYIKVALLILLIFTFSRLNASHLFPLWGSGMSTIAITGARNCSLFSESILLTAFYAFLRERKSIRKVTLAASGIAILEVSLFMAVYVAYFDVFNAQAVAYPFLQLARAIKIGNFITNLEAFYFAFWVIGGIIRFAIYLFTACYIFCKTFQVKRITSLLLSFGALTITLGLIPDNAIESTMLWKEQLLIPVTSGVVIGLPVLLSVLSMLKGARSK